MVSADRGITMRSWLSSKWTLTLLYQPGTACPIGLALFFLLAGFRPDALKAQEVVSGGEQLTEIVVTATKRSESLSKVSLAVSAFSQEELTNAGVVGLAN